MSAQNNTTIQGKLLNHNQQPLAQLRIEAWDMDLLIDDFVGEAVTDAEGRFSILFTEDHYKELFFDRKPDLYFKIYKGAKLLRDTKDKVVWNYDGQEKQFIIQLDIAAAGQDIVFSVSGNVSGENGQPVSRLQLIAYDVDLRAAGVYRAVSSLQEIESNTGFEYLETAYSDTNGNYTLGLYSFRAAKAERKKADVIVYAVDDKGVVLGRSALVNSGNYSPQNEVSGLNIVIGNTAPHTEYELLMAKLLPFLQESDMRLAELSVTGDQVMFLSAELDEPEANIRTAVAAELLRAKSQAAEVSHELLYGIGRQGFTLDWQALYHKREAEITAALQKSADENIISKTAANEVTGFLQSFHKLGILFTLDQETTDGTFPLRKMLEISLPEKEQQLALLTAYKNFRDQDRGAEPVDFSKFWQEYLPAVHEFNGQPKLIESLLFNQQLAILTGLHLPLVEALQTQQNISSITELADYEIDDWKEIIASVGVPAFVTSTDEQERIDNYASGIQSFINAAYPTEKIASMLRKERLPGISMDVSASILQFLRVNGDFNFAGSRVHEFQDRINEISADPKTLTSELQRLQRIYQVSVSPGAMGVLMENNLDSAYAISSIPRKNFLSTYSDALGGVVIATAMHQRAEHITSLKTEQLMKFHELSFAGSPVAAYSDTDRQDTMAVLLKKFPDYTDLFGSPDICACDACRSVYSPAAYLVDLLRFLSKSAKNAGGNSPLDIFAKRREDLLHLPLTCENTNTIIPYIDLVNEVMEYYTCYGSLDQNAAYDTGNATAAELRANPQNTSAAAYDILRKSVYSFSLPYHQPLDEIRTYSSYLKTERYELMQIMQRDDTWQTAIEAEVLQLSEEEFTALTGHKFNGEAWSAADTDTVPDPANVKAYFGYANDDDAGFAGIASVPEFLRRSGMKYTELVELLQTKFINSANTPVTLYQPQSSCDLDATVIRSAAEIPWLKIHRFIRLWRKLGWTISELDILLTALGETNIGITTIHKLAYVSLLNKELKLPLYKLAVLWGDIGTHGDRSLYKDLFLNRSVKNIDTVFEADSNGNYLAGNVPSFTAHIPAIVAAFRISEQELNAILQAIQGTAAILDIHNLSIVYRYVLLSKALDLKIPDCCLLIRLFNATPFERNALEKTLDFYTLARTVKESGFTATTLDYIFKAGSDTTLAPGKAQAAQAVATLKDLFHSFDKEYPASPAASLLLVTLKRMLPVYYQPEIVDQLLGIATITGSEDTAIAFNVPAQLSVPLPAPLRAKYTYAATSGQLSCKGIMSDAERTSLEAIPGAGASFLNAVALLYKAPKNLVADNFGSLFTDDDIAFLLDRKQPAPATTDAKLKLIYDKSLPVFRNRTYYDSFIKYIAEACSKTGPEIAAVITDDNSTINALYTALFTDGNAFYDCITRYHKAAITVAGFSLGKKEIDYFSKPANPSELGSLTHEKWTLLYNYVQLRNELPSSKISLPDVFADVNADAELLFTATGWDKESISYHAATAGDYKDVALLLKIKRTAALVSKTGASIATLKAWAAAGPAFEELSQSAASLKSFVKAQYEEKDWLTLSAELNNKIRRNQQQALISHLLTKEQLIAWGVTDADSLFEYFLIDVQMGPCMDTSRIVQATAAVQMFVTRCLLNLEKNTDEDDGVAPDAIDKTRWEWMKYYRVWEVNRRIFLYPENWLEPEWRDDRSPFFKELESELTQNDITARNVETAFRNYLSKMDTVAHLDICGVYQENFEPGGKMKLLHVFGRTHNAPYQFFYRTCNEFWKWSTWEKVPLDIRVTEAGNDSGVHLVPVVWKNRLYLFWAEFIEKQEQKNNNSSFTSLSGKNPASLATQKYWEIRLAWSEYTDGKWNPKQLSKEFITYKTLPGYEADSNIYKQIRLTSEIANNELLLKIDVYSLFYEHYGYLGFFRISNIQASIDTGFENYSLSKHQTANYSNNFEKQEKSGPLAFSDNTYLAGINGFRVTASNNTSFKKAVPTYPFFLQDLTRTYFVKPARTNDYDYFKNPGNYGLLLLDPEFSNLLPVIEPVHYAAAATVTSSEEYIAIGDRETRPVFIDTAINVIAGSHDALITSSAPAFGGIADSVVPALKSDSLAFHSFYHPYTAQFISNLNTGGIDKLLASDTLRNTNDRLEYNDRGKKFTQYQPNFTEGLVKAAPGKDDYQPGSAYTYYKENICFDVYGASSIYNWELFFHAPLYIANRLSKNGKFEEAMKWYHYIFDPTTDEAPAKNQTETARYWKTLPFKTTPAQTLEEWFETIGLAPGKDTTHENAIIAEWRNNPFKPFVVARNRPLAFMKNVVIKYVENLRQWGDSLFRTFTRESVNEALQLYVIANHILGPRPEFVPKRGNIKTETYDSLKSKLDDFSNAIVAMENILPYSSDIPAATGDAPPTMLGSGPAFYFCMPDNEALLEHWDTIADRLFKIRHCMDIDGVERQLALFAPRIDPAMLINAAAQGISLGDILSDISSPPPVYRFNYMLQRANDFCNEVKSLGNTLLSVLEKKDGEELGRIRAAHEAGMMELMTAIKEKQVLDAKAYKEGLLKSREAAALRLAHYNGLISATGIAIPAPPDVDAAAGADSALPADTSIVQVTAKANTALVDSGEMGVSLIAQELNELNKNAMVPGRQNSALQADIIAGYMGLYPEIGSHATPLGVGASLSFGGKALSWFASSVGKQFSYEAGIYASSASQSARMAAHIRREQDWVLQTNLSAREIIQLDKQITSASIKIQVAQKELSNHKQQLEHTRQVEQFLKDKFTKQELYQWMKEQLFTVYKQSFNMAYDMAKKAEQCYRYELGNNNTNFIRYGYWDNNMQGLCAGEQLQLALRQLEKSYLEENKRELELSKSISLALLDPLALEELRVTGKCFLSIPEEIYDLDYQGHYFRKIKSVSLSLPCIAGPYTTVNCTLRLLKNTIRLNTSVNPTYQRNNEDGMWTDDDRFRENNVPVKAIATSSGQRDPGVFELNFRDERYLPFEGAGAISEWKIELTQDVALRQFDYTTLADVILHINYTAREDAGAFRESAVTHLKHFFSGTEAVTPEPFRQIVNIKEEFPAEWHRSLHPPVPGLGQTLTIQLRKEHFPFFTQNRPIIAAGAAIYLRTEGDKTAAITFTVAGQESNPANSIPAPELAGMQKVSIAEITDIFSAITIRINTPGVTELFLFVPYKLG